MNSFGITLYIAQSDFDKFLKVPSSSINIDGSNLNDLDVLGTTLIQYSKNHYYHNDDFKSHILNSTSLHIQCTRYSNDYDTINNRRLNATSLGSSSSSLLSSSLSHESSSSSSTTSKSNNNQNSRRKLISSSISNHSLGLKILLQNKAPVTYIDIEAEVIEFKCVTPKAQPYEVVIDCKSSGLKYTATCPSSDRGTYNITCPRIFSIPQCQFYNGSTYIEDRSCEVIEYSSMTTTCHCISASLGTTTTSSSRRYLSPSSTMASNSINREYISTAILEITPFHSTFSILPIIVNQPHKKVILISSITFICLLFIVLINLFLWRNYSKTYIKENFKDKDQYRSSPSSLLLLLSLSSPSALSLSKNRNNIYDKRTIKSFYESLLPYSFRVSHKSWKTLIKTNIFLNHTWIRVLYTFITSYGLYSVMKIDLICQYWINLMLKLLTIIFFNSLLASIIYPYDETCINILTEKECNQHRSSYQSIFQSCEWITNNESCNYKGPDYDIYHILLFSAIVVILSTIYNQILDIFLNKSFITITKLLKYFSNYYNKNNFSKIHIENENFSTNDNNDYNYNSSNSKYKDIGGDINNENDEFKKYTTKKILFLLAARLEKTNKILKYVTTKDEASYVMKKNSFILSNQLQYYSHHDNDDISHSQHTQHNNDDNKHKNNIYDKKDNESLKKYLHQFDNYRQSYYEKKLLSKYVINVITLMTTMIKNSRRSAKKLHKYFLDIENNNGYSNNDGDDAEAYNDDFYHVDANTDNDDNHDNNNDEFNRKIHTKTLVKGEMNDVKEHEKHHHDKHHHHRDNEAIEIILMKNFLLDLIPTVYQSFLRAHLFTRIELSSIQSTILSYHLMDILFCIISIIVIILHLSIMLYLSVTYDNFVISINSTILWCIVLLTSLIKYYFFIEPIMIITRDVIITQYLVGGLFFEITNKLSLRTKLILMRSGGLMRDAHALVQHFNPACRVARLYPTLPLSRLLMSINDEDTRSLQIKQPSSSLNIKRIIATICFLPFAYMPYKIGEIFMLIFILALWNGIIFSFYILGLYNSTLTITIAIVIIIIIPFITIIYYKFFPTTSSFDGLRAGKLIPKNQLADIRINNTSTIHNDDDDENIHNEFANIAEDNNHDNDHHSSIDMHKSMNYSNQSNDADYNSTSNNNNNNHHRHHHHNFSNINNMNKKNMNRNISYKIDNDDFNNDFQYNDRSAFSTDNSSFKYNNHQNQLSTPGIQSDSNDDSHHDNYSHQSHVSGQRNHHSLTTPSSLLVPGSNLDQQSYATFVSTVFNDSNGQQQQQQYQRSSLVPSSSSSSLFHNSHQHTYNNNQYQHALLQQQQQQQNVPDHYSVEEVKFDDNKERNGRHGARQSTSRKKYIRGIYFNSDSNQQEQISYNNNHRDDHRVNRNKDHENSIEDAFNNHLFIGSNSSYNNINAFNDFDDNHSHFSNLSIESSLLRHNQHSHNNTDKNNSKILPVNGSPISASASYNDNNNNDNVSSTEYRNMITTSRRSPPTNINNNNRSLSRIYIDDGNDKDLYNLDYQSYLKQLRIKSANNNDNNNYNLSSNNGFNLYSTTYSNNIDDNNSNNNNNNNNYNNDVALFDPHGGHINIYPTLGQLYDNIDSSNLDFMLDSNPLSHHHQSRVNNNNSNSNNNSNNSSNNNTYKSYRMLSGNRSRKSVTSSTPTSSITNNNNNNNNVNAGPGMNAMMYDNDNFNYQSIYHNTSSRGNYNNIRGENMMMMNSQVSRQNVNGQMMNSRQSIGGDGNITNNNSYNNNSNSNIILHTPMTQNQLNNQTRNNRRSANRVRAKQI